MARPLCHHVAQSLVPKIVSPQLKSEGHPNDANNSAASKSCSLQSDSKFEFIERKSQWQFSASATGTFQWKLQLEVEPDNIDVSRGFSALRHSEPCFSPL